MSSNDNNSYTGTRRLAAILFADIVGYTALMQHGESKAMSIINRFQKVTKLYVEKFRGDTIKTYGDCSLILFDSAVDALNCAHEMQRAFKIDPIIPLRIGIHIGEVIKKDKDVFGNGVNIASRIESMGIAGSVLMSGDTQNKIRNQESLHTKSLGFFHFKNVDNPMEIYALNNSGLAVPTKRDIGGKFNKSTNVFRSPLWALLAIFLLVIGWYPLNKMTSIDNGFDKILEKSVAVLPLKNLNSADDGVGYFADGVTLEIIDQLTQIKAIRVSAFTVVSYYNQQSLSPEAIAQELNVNYLISGTSRLLVNEQRVRISVTLFNPRTKRSLWTETFDEEMDDASTIQLAVARKVAAKLRIVLTPSFKASLDQVKTTSGEALRIFLNAKLEVTQLTIESLIKSQELLRTAIILDPECAQVKERVNLLSLSKK